jgi:hypothetical protein
VSVRDSAGVTIIESEASSAVDSGWVLGGQPQLQIGVVDGDPSLQFSDILHAVRLGDSRIAVTDGGGRDLRFFAVDGRHLSTVGGRGEGPEEFRGTPRQVLVLPDGRITLQDRLDRLFYDAEGHFLERVGGRPDALEALVGVTSSGNLAWLGDGSLMAMLPEPLPTPLVPGGPARQKQHIVRVYGDYARADTLLSVGGAAYEVIAGGDFWAPVFYVSSRIALSSGGSPYLVADGGTAELHRLHVDGRHEIVRWGDAPAPITPSDAEKWIASFVARNPTQEQRIRASFAAIQVPEHKPVVAWLVAGREGGALVASGHPTDPAYDSVSWGVIDEDGAFLGRIDMPDGFVPRDFGADYVLGEWRDELDVPYVRLYALTRTPAAPRSRP